MEVTLGLSMAANPLETIRKGIGFLPAGAQRIKLYISRQVNSKYFPSISSSRKMMNFNA
jgi:hypothetical protein